MKLHNPLSILLLDCIIVLGSTISSLKGYSDTQESSYAYMNGADMRDTYIYGVPWFYPYTL